MVGDLTSFLNSMPQSLGNMLYPCLDQCSQMRTVLTTNSIPKAPYIAEGYSMTRTEAPKDLVGRGLTNLARTTPELPVEIQSAITSFFPRSEPSSAREYRTVRPGDAAPDHAVLGSADLLLSLVDVGDALAEVEAVVIVSL